MRFNFTLYYILIDSLQSRLDTLHAELAELRQRRQQQEIEIANIENLKLRQRFQEILDNLLTQEMQKVQEVCMHRNRVFIAKYPSLFWRENKVTDTDCRFKTCRWSDDISMSIRGELKVIFLARYKVHGRA